MPPAGNPLTYGPTPRPTSAPALPAPDDEARRGQIRRIRQEIAVILTAFWLPVTLSAVAVFITSRSGDITTRFAQVVSHHPLENMILGSLLYLPVAAAVPVALLLLTRSGTRLRDLGLGRPRLVADVVGAVLLAVFIYLVVIFCAVIIQAMGGLASAPTNTPSIGHLPAYYVIEAFVMSATTALAEECVMSGFLVTRLNQLGWSPGAVVTVATLLRTCYHAYYGVGMILTIPFSLIVTLDFQRHRRLNRVIGAHFAYDFTLLCLSILVVH